MYLSVQFFYAPGKTENKKSELEKKKKTNIRLKYRLSAFNFLSINAPDETPRVFLFPVINCISRVTKKITYYCKMTKIFPRYKM